MHHPSYLTTASRSYPSAYFCNGWRIQTGVQQGRQSSRGTAPGAGTPAAALPRESHPRFLHGDSDHPRDSDRHGLRPALIADCIIAQKRTVVKGPYSSGTVVPCDPERFRDVAPKHLQANGPSATAHLTKPASSRGELLETKNGLRTCHDLSAPWGGRRE